MNMHPANFESDRTVEVPLTKSVTSNDGWRGLSPWGPRYSVFISTGNSEGRRTAADAPADRHTVSLRVSFTFFGPPFEFPHISNSAHSEAVSAANHHFLFISTTRMLAVEHTISGKYCSNTYRTLGLRLKGLMIQHFPLVLRLLLLRLQPVVYDVLNIWGKRFKQLPSNNALRIKGTPLVIASSKCRG